MKVSDITNIELRSEKVRHIIGKVPPVLVRIGAIIITLIVVALAIAFYTIHYPITIEANGEVLPNDTLEITVPYKYLYLFDKPRQVSVSYEGQNDNVQPSLYPITSYSRKLYKADAGNFFVANAHIDSNSSKLHIGQKAEVRIIVSDKTLWQQIFN